MEPIKPRPRLSDQQRAALRRMQDFRPVYPSDTRRPRSETVPVSVKSSKTTTLPLVRSEQSAPAESPGRPRSKRWLVILIVSIVVILLGSGGAAAWWFMGRDKPVPQASTAATSSTPAATPVQQAAQPTSIRLIASGDELPHTAISQAAKTSGGYDYAQFFDAVKPVFDRADVRFCNQETVSAGEQYGITGYPSFNVSKQFARDLSTIGCNVISLANNHMHDKGQNGINETLNIWDELKPLAAAGANRNADDQRKVRYFTHREVKFAFVAYTEISNSSPSSGYSLNMLKEELVTQQLTEARAQADVVLVSVHWGTEYSDGINAAQDQWASRFAALGADVVIGTGPHVLEPVKRLPRTGGGETLVWYSLGNLLSAQLDVPSLIGGFAVMDISLSTKKVETIGFLPTYMHYEWTAEQKAKEDLLARRNFMIYPLDKAADALKKSQNNTTVEAQTERVRTLLNKHTTVPILNSEEYLKH